MVLLKNPESRKIEAIVRPGLEISFTELASVSDFIMQVAVSACKSWI